MDSFTTPVRASDFVLPPRVFDRPRRKRYISDSSEEEVVTAGSPLAQPLLDTPESDPETLVRHPKEPDDLSLSTPSDRRLGESPVDKANGKDGTQQINDAFLEDPEPLDSVASSSEDEPGPPCFCSTPIQIVEEGSEDDGFEEFRRRLGIELSEPVPRRERKKVMRIIVRVAVYAVLKHCLREKLFEDCEGCVIDAPAQRHHDCVTWTSVDINCKLRALCAELCLESLLNTVIAIGYAMQCLCLTQEHLAQGVTLINAVQFSGDPDRVLKKMTKPEDACLQRYIDRLVRTRSYRTLLKKKNICKKSKRIKLENGEGANMRYKTWQL
ncbi:uncharacterized protein LOC115657566 isoform X1 [Gopherus evgoodei]|uniref:uncharacterized protein LOC115641504 isoform X1 n=1 Tax=Gopherus evgoodei TaxID=1825980 RepID=UPI0011CF0991|nr:uncharacterized protein LOC115641504 isoform X1 [Gopherus evgoodei]XP_030420031.1 uncharacterized protein LOC115652301 isoform X1 [Gopherus evgoodei]XP_030425922.1 uncharacterized protein LOC115655031 isoform X1 [Gopherus evgoodei]XP_030431466.1 uncharacterized protein LOC115657566 isoform X1 [Gopherus evgoodei]